MNSLERLDELGLVDVPDELMHLTPSRLAVYGHLQQHEPASGKVIVEASGFSPGTVYPALHTLEDEGLAESRPDPRSPGTILFESTGPEVA